MDDLKFGTPDKRGNWSPNQPLEIAPFWMGKWDRMGRWIIAYLWPHNAIFMAVTLAYWVFVLPDWKVMKTFSWGWVLWIHAVQQRGHLPALRLGRAVLLRQAQARHAVQVQPQVPVREPQ